jgi:hypothetical protein
MNIKNVHIIGGGTFSHIRNHLALSTPAFGTTARQLNKLVETWIDDYDYRMNDYNVPYTFDNHIHLTKMADYESKLVTNDDVEQLVDQLIADSRTKVIFFNAAMCDFNGYISTYDQHGWLEDQSGKYEPRLHSRNGYWPPINLRAATKVIKKIRKERKDIFLVAFKTTCGATEDEQYIAGLNLLKENSCNLVLANDTKTRTNMIICPEEARYCVTTDRDVVLDTLVDMTMKRCQLHFTRSTVITDAPSIDWNSEVVPESLRTVVNYCIEKGAYKPFRGATAGHFAVKVDEKTFLTSKRSTNFNDLDKIGLVKVVSSSPDEVIAYGAKPSVGGQSQRIIFNEHTDVDCIVHFHCPTHSTLDLMEMPVRKQYAYECGSHECGQNTSNGLREVWHGIKAVFLDNHGPNIVFNRNIDPNNVIRFIDHFFDLSQKTGGLVTL